jgi:phenylpyruvate tautomerase PptA (4-oxalocrotonate tautomerase family)
MEDIIPKLVKAWAGDPDSLIVFIDLLETSKRKRDIADAITRVVAKKYLSREGQGNAVQSPVAAAHSVQGDESVSEVREQRADEGSRSEVS